MSSVYPCGVSAVWCRGSSAAAFSTGDTNGVCVLHPSSPVPVWELQGFEKSFSLSP